MGMKRTHDGYLYVIKKTFITITFHINELTVTPKYNNTYQVEMNQA